MKKKLLWMIPALLLLFAGCGGAGGETQESENTAEANQEITIYLVRHGKTWFNTTGQVQGFADSPLTDVGIEQAELVGEALAEKTFATAYSSDLGRQRNTAKLILEQNQNKTPQLTENNGFREKNFGGFEGQPNATMWNTIMEPYGLSYKDDWSDYPKLLEELGGEAGVVDAIAEKDELGAAETFDEVKTRGVKAMDQVITETTKAGGGNVLIVSSGGMIPILLEAIVPGEYQGEDIGNCSITTLTYKDGEYHLKKIADTSHLE